MTTTLVVGDEELPSYIYIYIDHYQDSYEPLSTMECHDRGFVTNVAHLMIQSCQIFTFYFGRMLRISSNMFAVFTSKKVHSANLKKNCPLKKKTFDVLSLSHRNLKK